MAYAAWVDPSLGSIDLGGRKRSYDDSIEQAIALAGTRKVASCDVTVAVTDELLITAAESI